MGVEAILSQEQSFPMLTHFAGTVLDYAHHQLHQFTRRGITDKVGPPHTVWQNLINEATTTIQLSLDTSGLGRLGTSFHSPLSPKLNILWTPTPCSCANCDPSACHASCLLTSPAIGRSSSPHEANIAAKASSKAAGLATAALTRTILPRESIRICETLSLHSQRASLRQTMAAIHWLESVVAEGKHRPSHSW